MRKIFTLLIVIVSIAVLAASAFGHYYPVNASMAKNSMVTITANTSSEALNNVAATTNQGNNLNAGANADGQGFQATMTKTGAAGTDTTAGATKNGLNAASTAGIINTTRTTDAAIEKVMGGTNKDGQRQDSATRKAPIANDQFATHATVIAYGP